MDWVKVRVNHAEYEFAGTQDNVFRAWIMMMMFIAAIESIPTPEQLASRLGKDNYNDLKNHFEKNGKNIDYIMDKVMEDVESVRRQREHARKYMGKYRRKALRKTVVSGKDKIREDKIREDKIREGASAPPPTSFIETLKANIAYKHINFEVELAKMDVWLNLPRNKGRKKTDRFILAWLNRVEASIDIKSPPKKPIVQDIPKINKEERKKVGELVHKTVRAMK